MHEKFLANISCPMGETERFSSEFKNKARKSNLSMTIGHCIG
jgi:hypothetical protein